MPRWVGAWGVVPRRWRSISNWNTEDCQAYVQGSCVGIRLKEKGVKQMYNNIGGKIKTLAELIAIFGIIGFVITGLVVMANAGFLAGLLVGGLGALGSWIGSFTLYGFGELIENTKVIADNYRNAKPKAKKTKNNSSTTKQQESPKEDILDNEGFETNDGEDEAPVDEENSWLCKKCGTINPNTIWNCKCCESAKWHSR